MLVIDEHRKGIRFGDEFVPLTPTEYAIVKALTDSKGEPRPAHWIMGRMGRLAPKRSDYVRWHIFRLNRAKLDGRIKHRPGWGWSLEAGAR
jgi:DNA-binding response OmpR family regulator